MSELADLWYEPPSVQERIAMQGEISALRARVAQLEAALRQTKITAEVLGYTALVPHIDAAIREAKP